MSTPPSNSQTQQSSNVEPSTSSGTSQLRPGQTADEARKDRTLAEFLLMLDDYEPLVTTSAVRVSPLISNSPYPASRFQTKLPITTCNASASNVKMFACRPSLLASPVACSHSFHPHFSLNKESVCCRWQLKSSSPTSRQTLTSMPASAPMPRGVVPGPTKHWDLERLAYVPLVTVSFASVTAYRILHLP